MPSEHAQPPIRFTPEAVALFSRASHDVNPLHLSPEFARTTPHGQPVVFGILGVVAGLGRLKARADAAIQKLTVDFPSPMFAGVAYRVVVNDDGGAKAGFKLYDGQRLVCRASIRFQARSGALLSSSRKSPDLLSLPADWTDAQLQSGATIKKVYAPEESALIEMTKKFDLDASGLIRFQLGVLLWSSYFIGMEIPGRRALFSRLTLDFADALPESATAFDYQSTIHSFDQRYAILSIDADLSLDGKPLAHAALQSFVNRPPRGDENKNLLLKANIQPRLAGKSALVIGGSRGLGGAIAQALVLSGCTTYATYLKGKVEAERLRDELPVDARDRFQILQWDGASAADCRKIRTHIEHYHGSLDFLICNASPPLLPLWLEEGSLDRIHDYMAKAIQIYTVPLSIFLKTMTPKTGRVVAISSIAVEELIAEWPHYIAAKRAIEALIDVAAKEHPNLNYLIVRPPRLLTDLTNNPLGRHQALMPEQVALALTNKLFVSEKQDQVEILKLF